MLDQPIYRLTDEREIVALIAANPWVTMVTAVPGQDPVVSHLPVLVDDTTELTLLGHLATPDGALHGLGAHDAVVIVEGPNGYITPSWYVGGPYVPTWNFMVVHLFGRPEPTCDEETFEILERTVEHFETARPEPWRLSSVTGYARRIAPGAVGFRMRPQRVVAKAKLSQDKPVEVIARVMDALETDPSHGNPALASAMRRLVPVGSAVGGSGAQ